ncbi:hypothetical protein A2U01_0105554, partial [Trifolium medium]|nr:hypothetical protein [Trifolium medium]
MWQAMMTWRVSIVHYVARHADMA